MKIEGIDPELLNRPLGELALNQEGNNSMQVENADALIPETAPAANEPAPALDGDGKVPYTRFKKFHDRALEAEQQAEFWRQQAMQSQVRPEPTQNLYQAPAPSQYVEPVYQGADWENFKSLFAGADENAVKSAYRQEIQRVAAVEERAYQRAVEAFDQRSQSQRDTFRANRDYLDEWTEEVSDLAGRALSDDEQVQLLDIMDEFSAKDNEGNIIAPMGAEQALRIYQMQNSSSHQERRAARVAVAQTSSGSSGGDTTVAVTPQENNQQFNAQVGWRANFRRITGRDPNNT